MIVVGLLGEKNKFVGFLVLKSLASDNLIFPRYSYAYTVQYIGSLKLVGIEKSVSVNRSF